MVVVAEFVEWLHRATIRYNTGNPVFTIVAVNDDS